MQKTTSLLSCFLLIVCLSNCSRKIDPEGTYQQSAVKADGELNDWSLPLRFGNKQGTIQYSITNDKENVYIALLSKDEATEEKILRMGLTVYFDPSGGDSKTISISYPMPGPGGLKAETNKDPSRGGMNINQKSRKQEMMLQSSAFTIAGFQHLENRSYDLSEKHPIQLALKTKDDNSLVYEAAVPIRNILGHPLTVNDPKKNFSIGFIIKSFQRTGQSGGGSPAVRSGGRGMGGGRMGGGRGMGGRGGMGGGAANPTGSSGRNDLFKDDVSWYKFRLAFQ